MWDASEALTSARAFFDGLGLGDCDGEWIGFVRRMDSVERLVGLMRRAVELGEIELPQQEEKADEEGDAAEARIAVQAVVCEALNELFAGDVEAARMIAGEDAAFAELDDCLRQVAEDSPAQHRRLQKDLSDAGGARAVFDGVFSSLR